MLKLAAALPLLALAGFTQPGCDLNGCLNGADCSSVPVTGPDMAKPPLCSSGCGGGCGSGEQCFVPAGVTQLGDFCAHPCTDDRDCNGGARCVVLFAALLPSACMGGPMTIPCAQPGGTCDTLAQCHGANSADVPFADSGRGICGWERVHCANGCSNGACN
ncbi:MAG TPA: hypothetical protein VN947_22090 [Polyangia bacterium]|nr:hypothetical protein [Polyangia bacterium]